MVYIVHGILCMTRLFEPAFTPDGEADCFLSYECDTLWSIIFNDFRPIETFSFGFFSM